MFLILCLLGVFLSEQYLYSFLFLSLCDNLFADDHVQERDSNKFAETWQVAETGVTLESPAMENVLRDCIRTSSNPEAVFDVVGQTLRCLSSAFSPGEQYTSVLQRMFSSMRACLESTTGSMHCVVCCCLLCVGLEMSSFQNSSSESSQEVQALVYLLSTLRAESRDLDIDAFLDRLVELCNNRGQPQLAEHLHHQSDIIRWGVLLQD